MDLGQFITHAMLVRSVAIPHHEKMVLASVSRAKDLVQNLSDVLVEEPEPIKMAAFFSQLSKQAASKMKELRAKLKEEEGLEHDPALKSKADEILLRSRQQLLKWGLSKFLTFESIRLPTPAGKQLRRSLKALWDKDICDTDFQKYLGTDVDEIESIFAMDSAPAQKALQQAPDMTSQPASSAHALKERVKRPARACSKGTPGGVPRRALGSDKK